MKDYKVEYVELHDYTIGLKIKNKKIKFRHLLIL